MSGGRVPPRDRLVTLPDGLPELTLGWGALEFAARYLRHPNGLRAREPWMCTDEQMRFVLWWYAVNPDGSWVFDHGVRRLAKGSGKSPMAAVLALMELCGPVRLDHFSSNVDGGCVGRPVDMPNVQVAAVSAEQTENTMRMVRAMAGKGTPLCKAFSLDPGRIQINKQPEGSLKILTSAALTAEGAEATAVVADETENWLKSRGGTEFHATLVDNLSKTGSRMVETCNAWKPGIGSVAEAAFTDWCEAEEGISSVKGSKILYDARIAPLDTDLHDQESLRHALEFVYADCPWANLDAIEKRFYTPSAKLDDLKRKYFNWPTAPEDAWMEQQDWQRLARYDRHLNDGERVVLFFDGSKSNDSTALVGCCLEDGHIFTVGVWLPHGGGDSDTVDVVAVDNAVQRCFEKFTVAGFFADVREFESFTKMTWPERYQDQVELWAVPGGKTPEPIAWDMRSHGYEFAQACELVEAEILEGTFTHDGNPFLTEHVLNARRKETRYGAITIRKESPLSRKKIDAAVCMIGARMVYRLAIQDTKQEKRKRTGQAAFF